MSEADTVSGTGAEPRVSVLMTTHNGAALIGESIATVLNQSMREFELIVVDDASTDSTPSLLQAFAQRDGRIRVLRADRNLGVVGSRNMGFAACRGAYLAALDHDDLCHPDRLALQSAYLDRTPEVVLVGTQIAILNDKRREIARNPGGLSPAAARWLLHIDNPLTWSSVMMRVDAVRRLGQFLRPEAEYADDFDLYHRLARIGDIAWLDDVLTTYRVHGANTSKSHAPILYANAVRVLGNVYRPWLPADAEVSAALVVKHLSDRRPIRDVATLRRLAIVLQAVLDGFLKEHPGCSPEIKAIAARTWWSTVRAAVRSGQPALIAEWRPASRLSGPYRPGRIDLLSSVAVGIVRAVANRTVRGRTP